MKKGDFTLSEHLLGASYNTLSNGYTNEDYLLLITSVGNMQLQATNWIANNYFQYHLEKEKKSCFYNSVIHPEDITAFKNSLILENQGEPIEQKQVMVRMLSPFGYWKKFLFKNRRYRGFREINDSYVLSVGYPLDPLKIKPGSESAASIENEKTLQESLNRYRTLINSLDQGFAVIDLILDKDEKVFDYLFMETNAAFDRHTEMKGQLGKTMREIFQDHEIHWFQTFGKVAVTGESTRFESYAKAHKRWFDVYAFPIGKTRSRRVALLFSDITARKATEKKLKQANENLEYTVRKRTHDLEVNNELLQMVFDSTSEGIFLLKPLFGNNFDIIDFIYVRVNKKVIRYYKQEMVGKRFLDLNPQSAQTGSFEILKQTMLTGASRDFEVQFEQKGKKNWFKITTRRQRGMLINTLENITRKKLRSQKLKNSLRFKKQLIETSPDVILIFNLYSQKIKYVNRKSISNSELPGNSIKNMPLQKILTLIHPQDRKKAIHFHKSLMLAKDKDLFELEFRLKGEGHTWNFYSARGKVFKRNSKGSVSEYIVVLRNVQEQKRTQQALIQAEKLSIKGEIARTLAHELRNPIASIGMSADILDKKTTEPAGNELKNYIEIIKRSTNTLNNLVTDLLSSSQYSPAILKKCCLAETTKAALDLAQDRIYLAGVQVKEKIEGPCYIYADKQKLQIALLNIIVNASEAMLPEKGVLRVKIDKAQKSYQLTISDNGCGMHQEQLERLFESFYTQKPEGMGIGLSSVKNILEEHDATVKVKSQPGKGTTFVLSFQKYESFSRK